MKAILFSNPKANKAYQDKINQTRKQLKLNNVSLEEVDIEHFGVSERAQVYDVVTVPSLVILTEDGAVQGIWQKDLPDYSAISQAIGYL